VHQQLKTATLYVTLLLATHAAWGQTQETDWLYFPMYERDTAHAVHLAVLKFRPDGLLTSATRYPRFSEEEWTPQENQRGWYSYETRLIDCETGYFVSTTSALLDQVGQTVASHPAGVTQWLERLKGQLLSNRKWPESGGEIYLACAGASDAALKARRSQQARVKLPLLSYKPITQDLSADSVLLFERREFKYDLSRLQKNLPTSAMALFEALRLQHTAWKKSIDPGYAPSSRWSAAQQEKFQKNIKNVRVLGPGYFEMDRPWSIAWNVIGAFKLSPQTEDAFVDATERVLSDCTSGLQVPTSLRWLGRNEQVLDTKPVTAKQALLAVEEDMRHELNTHWDLVRVPYRNTSLRELCISIFSTTNSTNDSSISEENSWPFGLRETDLAQLKTPEAMLLKIRDARRTYQPST
jgi:hypothetical protein